jgi:hypothetical protein
MPFRDDLLIRQRVPSYFIIFASKMAKEKVAKKNINCHEEFRNGSNCAQRRRQFKERMKKQGGQANLRQRKVVIVSVLLTNALFIQMAITHGGIATRTLSIKTRNSLQRVPKRVKHPCTRPI